MINVDSFLFIDLIGAAMSWEYLFGREGFEEMQVAQDVQQYKADAEDLHKALLNVMKLIKRQPGGGWTTTTKLGIRVNLDPNLCWQLDNALIVLRRLRAREETP